MTLWSLTIPADIKQQMNGARISTVDRIISLSLKFLTNAIAIRETGDNGIVNRICRSTGSGHDLYFYFHRVMFPNDPRGIGAVMIAGTKVSGL